MADDPATKPKEQAKLMEQKAGEESSDDSTTKLAGSSKSMEEKEEKRSSDSTANLAGPSKISDLLDIELDLQGHRNSLELIEQKGGKGSDHSLAEWALPFEISMTADQESSGYGTTEWESMESLLSELNSDSNSDKEERSDDSTTKLPGPSKELEKVLLHTRRLTVCDKYSSTRVMLRREATSATEPNIPFNSDTVLRDDAGLKLHVDKWMSTGDETDLELRPAHFLRDVVSTLAPLCPQVEHLSIDLHRSPLLLHQFTYMPMPMRSVITVCFIKSQHIIGTLLEALFEVSKYFPNAESLDIQMERLCSPSNLAYFPEINSSSSLRELKLSLLKLSKVSFSDDVPTESLFLYISTSCPNIVTLVLLGFGRRLSNKSGTLIEPYKMPRLSNIHVDPFGTDDCCRFETLTNVLHVVTSPHLKLVEAKKVQLEGTKLASVKWSRTSSGDELQLEGASAVVPLADLMHRVSNELEGVTVLTFNGCNVDVIRHPPQSKGKESSLRELKFLNVERPLSQTDIQKLSEMYPNVKVTVEHERRASHEDSDQDTGMTFKPERKTSPTSSIVGHELVGATARVQVHEEQTDNQTTEEQGKEEEEENEEKEQGYMAIKSLLHETGEENVTQIKMERRERVGLEGGKIQLDSFGIELEIPPGAIDSEAPQDISLRVLTDTPNLGNSKEEMSVCFGVQCLAPDDLVLKLPVTYTIPHCAVITRYSSVKAVLYTGEGEYSPDAVVKERGILLRSEIPSCTITKDVLKLKMNHFSWAKIKLMIKNFFFKGKKMRCRPFKENNLALQKTPVILRAHLYDAIKGNCELIKRQEEEQEFVPAHPEQEVVIQVAESDVKMTCYVKETVIGRPAVVPFDKLMSGARICEPFELDFTNQPDIVAVLLRVGQIERLEDKLLFPLDFSTPHRRMRTSPQDQEELQGASSSRTLQTSHQSPDDTPENSSGKQDDFEKKLTIVARKVATRVDIDNLMKALGLQPGDVQHYVNDNTNSSYMVTLSMLRDWRKKQTKAKECGALKDVLEEAGQTYLADELFGTS